MKMIKQMQKSHPTAFQRYAQSVSRSTSCRDLNLGWILIALKTTLVSGQCAKWK